MDKWYEVWADDTLSPHPYVLLVMPDQKVPGAVVVLDPRERYEVVYTASSYQLVENWLLEDEYRRVTGRMDPDEYSGW
ncbi:MAG TPA: hypothetical protein VGN57_08105 [Pirellulaceae bacterium]|nr:hypothetical protein [Pirellulaceae bacterium]